MLVYFTRFTVCSGDIKSSENDVKKSSENDQSTGHFQSLFCPPTLNLTKIPVNQLIKKSGLSILGTLWVVNSI